MSIVPRRVYDKLKIDRNIARSVALKWANFLGFTLLSCFNVFGFSTNDRSGLPIRLDQGRYSFRIIAMQNKLIFTPVFCVLLPISAVAQESVGTPSLRNLHQAIAELVVQHYPASTSHVFEETIGFEYSTRVFVTRQVSKVPPGTEAPRAPERGPKDDGVWCSIWYRAGDLNKEPAYARGEGAIKREFFKEYTYYPNDIRNQCHLLVTLRLPLETTDEQRLFVKELRVLLNQFGKYLSAKDR